MPPPPAYLWYNVMYKCNKNIEMPQIKQIRLTLGICCCNFVAFKQLNGVQNETSFFMFCFREIPNNCLRISKEHNV